MSLTRSNFKMVDAVFPSLAAFTAATLPVVVVTASVFAEDRIIHFKRNTSYTAAQTLADGSEWIPAGDITPLHFGGVPSHITDWDDVDTQLIDARAAWQAAIDFAGDVSEDTIFRINSARPFSSRVIIDGCGLCWGISDELTFTNDNDGNHVRDASLIAIDSGNWTTDTLLGKDRADKFMLHPGALATYMRFENLFINCNNLCGGVKGRARTRIAACYITHCAGFGIEFAGSDVYADHCLIQQWEIADPEYYDPDAYTGIGLYFSESDGRADNCVVFWLDRLVHFGATNNLIRGGHYFNGMQNYTADVRATNPSAANINAALADYFSIPLATAETTDFTRRTEHIGFYVEAGGKFWDNTVEDVYFDNCHHELYSDGIQFTAGCVWGSKSTSSLLTADSDTPGLTYGYGDSPSIDYWIKCYAYEVDAKPSLQIAGWKTFVDSAERHLVKFVSYEANNWEYAFLNWNQNEVYNFATSTGAIHSADGFTLSPPKFNFVTTSDTVAGQTFGAPGPGSFIGFWDPTTTTVPLIGGRGDDLRLRASGSVITGVLLSDLKGADTGSMTISTGNSGVTSAPVGSDDLIIENSQSAGITIAVPNGSNININVATPANSNRAGIRWNDTAGQWEFLINNSVVQTIS